MRRSGIILVTLLAVAGGDAQGNAAPGDGQSDWSGPPGNEASIRVVFDRYKDAAMRDEGREVAALVSNESIAHYGGLLRAAQASGGKVSDRDSLRLVDRMQIEMLRKMLSPERLASMTPTEAVAYAFEGRMLGEEFEASSRLDRIAIEGDAATARHVARGRAVGAPYREATFRFVRQDGEWRVDLFHTLELMEAQLGDLAVHSGVPAEDLAEKIVSVFTGEALARGIETLRRDGSLAAWP
jgi:hypothetical protein